MGTTAVVNCIEMPEIYSLFVIKAGVALWPFFFMSRHMLSHKYVATFTPRESWRSHVWDINDIYTYI